MIINTLALSASALVLSVLALPAQAAINAPVPTANYIVFGGDDWAWASPCPPSGFLDTTQCGDGDTVDFSYQATQGWRLATAADLAAGPSVADFGTPSNFACAAAWFTKSYNYCDYGDAAAGAVYNAPGGNVWYSETWVIRDGNGAVPEPASWAMMIAGFGLVGAAARRRRSQVVTG